LVPTVFGRILGDVVEQLPGALGAVFIDWEGEAVDQFAHIGTMDVRLIGAHWGIVMAQAQAALEKLELGTPRQMVLRFTDQQIIIRRVDQDYVVVLAMSAEAHLGRALTLLGRAEARLRAEM
jgi:predicted regulator of Ras-like GTPase activity (Roadblock/LC7/MglB family)